MATNWTSRTSPSTTWKSRTDVNFLVTQALDFLMTENDNYIVLQDSYTINTQYTVRTTI